MTDDLKQRAEHFTAMQKAANSRHGTGEYAGLTEYAEFTKLCAMTSLVRDQQAEIERLRSLNSRAMNIIAEAIMHGMPITEEVAAVRNEIVTTKAAEPAPEGGD